VSHARSQHPNAPPTPEGRRRMVGCVVDGGWSVTATAERFQVDAKTVRKWRDRFLSEGPGGLRDREKARIPVRRTASAPGTVDPEEVARMHVTVVGAGSWGTTVAALAAANTPTTLWARRPELAGSIGETGENADYLPGFPLPGNLTCTSDLEQARPVRPLGGPRAEPHQGDRAGQPHPHD